MANVGGRQLTLGACGLTKFAETADGRKVQLHIPKYVQGARKRNNQSRVTEWHFSPESWPGAFGPCTFWLTDSARDKMAELANLGRVPYLGVPFPEQGTV